MFNEQLIQVVLELINAETEAKRQQLIQRKHELLLTDAADQLLASWQAQLGNSNYVRFIQECRTLLARCSEVGIEVAFSETSSNQKPSSLATDELLDLLIMELNQMTYFQDPPRYFELCNRTLELVDRKVQPQLWAALQRELGNFLQQNQQGKRAENVEQAIESFQQALMVFTRSAVPFEWAGTINKLATAYTRRIRGERAENIEIAIGYYEAGT